MKCSQMSLKMLILGTYSLKKYTNILGNCKKKNMPGKSKKKGIGWKYALLDTISSLELADFYLILKKKYSANWCHVKTSWKFVTFNFNTFCFVFFF